MTIMRRYSFAVFMGLAWLVAAPLVAVADELSDLKAQITALMSRIEALEAKANAAAEPAAAEPAAAERTVTSGNSGVRLAISGQVNRAVLFADAGRVCEFADRRCEHCPATTL